MTALDEDREQVFEQFLAEEIGDAFGPGRRPRPNLSDERAVIAARQDGEERRGDVPGPRKLSARPRTLMPKIDKPTFQGKNTSTTPTQGPTTIVT